MNFTINKDSGIDGDKVIACLGNDDSEVIGRGQDEHEAARNCLEQIKSQINDELQTINHNGVV